MCVRRRCFKMYVRQNRARCYVTPGYSALYCTQAGRLQPVDSLAYTHAYHSQLNGRALLVCMAVSIQRAALFPDSLFARTKVELGWNLGEQE